MTKALITGVLVAIATVSIMSGIIAVAPPIAGIVVIGGLVWYTIKFHPNFPNSK